MVHMNANAGEDWMVRNDSRLHPKDAKLVVGHLHAASSDSWPETREERGMAKTLETFGRSSWSLRGLSVNNSLGRVGA